MTADGYRTLLDCRARSHTLRGKGFTYDQIADVLALDHPASPLRLHRYAHGRGGGDIAHHYNQLDPAGTAALRDARLYDYETWPTAGRRPPARTLATLARIYQTTARRLITDDTYRTYSAHDQSVIDSVDWRHLDIHHRDRRTVVERASMEEEEDGGPPQAAKPSRLPAKDCADLLRAIEAVEADVKRRDLLFELALTLGGLHALRLLRHLDPEDCVRLAHVVHGTGNFDAKAMSTIEQLTLECRHLDDHLGPERILPTVDSQRELLTRLLRRESLLPALRSRLLGAYGELCQLAGWLHYDQLDYGTACVRLHEGLHAAHELGDPNLIAYLHSSLSHVAFYREQPTNALDHAFATETWAIRSSSRILKSWASWTVARAAAVAGEESRYSRALDRAAELAPERPAENDPRYLYWWTSVRAQATSTGALISLRRPSEAIAAAERQLASWNATYGREHALTLIYYGQALIQKREIAEATGKLAQATEIAKTHSSARILDALHKARSELQPWAANAHVRQFDEQLRALAL